MRLIAILTLALLAGCAHGNAVPLPPTPSARLSEQRPTIQVADAALAAGAPDVALTVANGLLVDHPGDSAARLRKGQAEYRLGDLASAWASFAKVIAAEPLSFEAQLGLGRIELATNATKAQARFQRLAALQPKNAAALTDLGIADDLLGQHELAQRMYRTALAIAPGLVSARSNLGLSLALSAQPDLALQVLRPLDATQFQSAQLRENLTTVLANPVGEAADIPPLQMTAPRQAFRNAGS
jgi:Flp pilus assembly protein TadD